MGQGFGLVGGGGVGVMGGCGDGADGEGADVWGVGTGDDTRRRHQQGIPSNWCGEGGLMPLGWKGQVGVW